MGCMIGGFILCLMCPVIWFFGQRIAKYGYEKATGSEFGSEWLAEAFKSTIFKTCISAIVSCAWFGTLLIWNMEGDGEGLAWGWGSVAFTSVLATVASVFNWYYAWAPEGGESGGFFGWGAAGNDAESQAVNEDRRGSNYSACDTDVK